MLLLLIGYSIWFISAAISSWLITLAFDELALSDLLMSIVFGPILLVAMILATIVVIVYEAFIGGRDVPMWEKKNNEK
jgi:hypothetical protein